MRSIYIIATDSVEAKLLVIELLSGKTPTETIRDLINTSTMVDEWLDETIEDLFE